MSSRIQFHFVAVNFNNSEYTIAYIKSIISLNHNDSNIIIIDNNSQNEDKINLEISCNNYKNVTLIKNNKNAGYFPALNIGLANIIRGENDYVVIGNNDITFHKNFLQNISSLVINSNILVIAPNIITLDNKHQNPHIINKFNLIKRIYRRIYYSNYYVSIILQYIYSIIKHYNGGADRKYHDKTMKILMGYGACYILTPNFFKHYTNLDAPVFLMGEEGILANQVLRACGITLYYPELIVSHHDHSSIGKLPNKSIFKFSQISYKYYLKNCKYLK